MFPTFRKPEGLLSCLQKPPLHTLELAHSSSHLHSLLLEDLV